MLGLLFCAARQSRGLFVVNKVYEVSLCAVATKVEIVGPVITGRDT
jgi:hypothetical protein